MPAGVVRSGDYRKGTPIVLPHVFGNPVAGSNQPFGNVNPQSNPSMNSNQITLPQSFGNQVGFLLQCVPPVVVIPQGSSGTVNINLTALLGQAPSMALTYADAPAGVTVAFAPSTDVGTSVATITVAASTTPGRYTILVIGTAGTEVDGVNIHLVVANPNATANIAFVGTANANLPVAGLNQTITVPYVSQAGNTLLLQITCSNDGGTVGAVQSITDSAGNVWTQLNTETAPSSDYQELWGCANASAITSVTATVAGIASNPNNGFYLFSGVMEYSGVIGFGPSSTTDSSASPGQPATITQTLTSGGNWVVAVFLSSQMSATNTPSMGNLRYQVGFAAGAGHATSSGTNLAFVSGGHFVPPFAGLVSWVGSTLVFNGSNFTVASVPSQTSLNLTTSPGALTNKSWSYNAQGPGNTLDGVDNTAVTASPVTVSVTQGSNSFWGAIAVELLA